MALQQFVRFFTVMILLFYKGCHSWSTECGRITQTGNPRTWPWRVSIDVMNSYIAEGSLITDQWVLTLAQDIQDYPLSDISVYLDSIDQLSSPHVYFTLEERVCDPGNELCLLKLASPVTLTDRVQPICLASEDSTFYGGTESWITRFSVAATEESNLEIIGNNECQCYLGSLSEDKICAGLKERGTTCLGSWGGALMNKNDSVWVQSGVLSSNDGCSVPSEAGVFVRVSQHQKWINDTVTGKPPGFVTFISPGTDDDLYFTCFTDHSDESTDDFDDSDDSTDDSTDDSKYLPNPECDSVFCGGESLINFNHFTAVCVLVVSLHVFVGSGGI